MITVRIVSIGPNDPEYLNKITLKEFSGKNPVIFRTEIHPAVQWFRKKRMTFETLDCFYESCNDFDTLSAAAAKKVWQRATEFGTVVYAVPDAVTDGTVDEIFRMKPENANVVMIPGISYTDYYLSVCRPLFSTADIRICPASSFLHTDMDPAVSVLITEINDGVTAGEVKQHLSNWLDDEESIWFLNADAEPRKIPLYELDRQTGYDHLAAVASKGRHYRQRKKKTFMDLMHIMNLLRSREGCPWDRIQTHESLLPYLIEEAWEVVAAIREKESDHIAEELGDLMFQIAFHTSIGTSFEEFTVSDVISGICDKMIRRHPDVFSEEDHTAAVFHPEEWERIKQQECGSRSVSESLLYISEGITALQYAGKIIKKLKACPSLKRTPEEITESVETICESLRNSDDDERAHLLGALLFCSTELAVSCGSDGELLLHETAKKLVSAYNAFENCGKNVCKPPESLTFNDLGVY